MFKCCCIWHFTAFMSEWHHCSRIEPPLLILVTLIKQCNLLYLINFDCNARGFRGVIAGAAAGVDLGTVFDVVAASLSSLSEPYAARNSIPATGRLSDFFVIVRWTVPSPNIKLPVIYNSMTTRTSQNKQAMTDLYFFNSKKIFNPVGLYATCNYV